MVGHKDAVSAILLAIADHWREEDALDG
jgi:hypothetical protein